MTTSRPRPRSPNLYRRRSAVFALLFAIGFFGGWAISLATLGRYEPAFATVGAHWGSRGLLSAALVALGIIVVAMSLRIWGSSYLSATTAWDEEAHTEALIIAGPFRFLRHPLYLGNILLALGLGAAAPLCGWIFIVISNAIFVRWLVAYEDMLLATYHLEGFMEYRRQVPAMLPRVWPVPPHQGPKPSLAQGLRAESFTIFVIAGITGLFAIPKYGVLVLVGCYLVGIAVQLRIERA